jgi:hypothetical protein
LDPDTARAVARLRSEARAVAFGACIAMAVVVGWAQQQASTLGPGASSDAWFAVDSAASRLSNTASFVALAAALASAAAWYVLVERLPVAWLRHFAAWPAPPTGQRLARRFALVWLLGAYGLVVAVGLLASQDGVWSIKQTVDGMILAIPGNAARRVVVSLAAVAAIITINALVASLQARRGARHARRSGAAAAAPGLRGR